MSDDRTIKADLDDYTHVQFNPDDGSYLITQDYARHEAMLLNIDVAQKLLKFMFQQQYDNSLADYRTRNNLPAQ